MSQGSWHVNPLPSNWAQIRRRVLERDNHECQWLADGWYCGARANQVDHIVPGGSDDLSNLQALCEQHHELKSKREGAAAYWKKRREIDKRLRKPAEKHPGLP